MTAANAPHPLVWAALLSLFLSGCVSPVERELRTREAHYRTVLTTLKPNSTRAELSRLLPPTAQAMPHNIYLTLPGNRAQENRSFSGVNGSSISIHALGGSNRHVGLPPARNFGREIHPLDPDFHLIVTYEYRDHRFICRPPPRALGDSAIRASNIDALLFGELDHPNSRVYPSPRDRIVRDPYVLRCSCLPVRTSWHLYSPATPKTTLTSSSR